MNPIPVPLPVPIPIPLEMDLVIGKKTPILPGQMRTVAVSMVKTTPPMELMEPICCPLSAFLPFPTFPLPETPALALDLD